jgi:hypothetical protein
MNSVMSGVVTLEATLVICLLLVTTDADPLVSLGAAMVNVQN